MTPEQESAEIRKAMVQVGQPAIDLAADEDGPKWTTAQLQQDFTVVGFAAPYVVVVRKADNVKGTLEFTHSPRVYFNWQEAGE